MTVLEIRTATEVCDLRMLNGGVCNTHTPQHFSLPLAPTPWHLTNL